MNICCSSKDKGLDSLWLSLCEYHYVCFMKRELIYSMSNLYVFQSGIAMMCSPFLVEFFFDPSKLRRFWFDTNYWHNPYLLQIVKELLSVPGIQVNQRSPEGSTALLGAADKGHHALVRILLEHPDTDPNVRDKQGTLNLIVKIRWWMFWIICIAWILYFFNESGIIIFCKQGHYRFFIYDKISSW